jgi:hypothetical protein
MGEGQEMVRVNNPRAREQDQRRSHYQRDSGGEREGGYDPSRGEVNNYSNPSLHTASYPEENPQIITQLVRGTVQ